MLLQPLCLFTQTTLVAGQEPLDIAKMMIERIDAKRAALGIDKQRERVLFDMEMRRDLGTGGLKDAGCHGPAK